jgi:predicted RNA-binding Zn ribbon-like protein
MDHTRAALLSAFLNTRVLHGVPDCLLDPDTYRRWATEWAPDASNDEAIDAPALLAALHPYAGEPSEDDLALLRTTRDTLLAMLDGRTEVASAFDDLAAWLRLEPRSEDGALRLAPVTAGPAGVAALAVALAFEAIADGTWDRMDRCRSDDCRWVFVDRSRNRSRRWCDMAACGNVQKVRAFRERQRAGD